MLKEAHDPEVLAHYRGLVFKTAQMIVAVPGFEEDFEDVQQVLMIKVYRALVAYDPDRSALPRDRFVFGCLRNQVNDIVKKKRRRELFIEDLAPDRANVQRGAHDMTRDSFEDRYLSTTHDQVFGPIEDDDVLVPCTLTELEREIVVLLYRDYKQSEAARLLGIGKREMESAMRSIRTKMSDWRPPAIADITPGQAETAIAA